MPTFKQAVVYAAVAGASYAGWQELQPAASADSERRNAQIEACASALGTNVIHNAALPLTCHPFERDFASRKQLTVVHNPNKAPGKEAYTSVTRASYTLSSARTFQKRAHANAYEMGNDKPWLDYESLAIGAFVGGLAVAGFSLVLSERNETASSMRFTKTNRRDI